MTEELLTGANEGNKGLGGNHHVMLTIAELDVLIGRLEAARETLCLLVDGAEIVQRAHSQTNGRVPHGTTLLRNSTNETGRHAPTSPAPKAQAAPGSDHEEVRSDTGSGSKVLGKDPGARQGAGKKKPAKAYSRQSGSSLYEADAISFIRDKKTVRACEITRRCGCSSSTSTTLLKALAERGLIEQIGRGQYSWNDSTAKRQIGPTTEKNPVNPVQVSAEAPAQRRATTEIQINREDGAPIATLTVARDAKTKVEEILEQSNVAIEAISPVGFDGIKIGQLLPDPFHVEDLAVLVETQGRASQWIARWKGLGWIDTPKPLTYRRSAKFGTR